MNKKNLIHLKSADCYLDTTTGMVYEEHLDGYPLPDTEKHLNKKTPIDFWDELDTTDLITCLQYYIGKPPHFKEAQNVT
jgi:hypothetical protein